MNDSTRSQEMNFLEMDFDGDASLGALLTALEPHAGKALVIDYGGRRIRPGYHVTEVKAGSFVTLDCGVNPASWRETILQVEDSGAEGGRDYLSVGKFRGILDQVARRVALDPDARLTFEVGPPGAAMQVFDVDALHLEAGHVVLRLTARSAICKPRHRAQQAATACCSPRTTAGACCAR
ncbi:hypothetical protein FHS82_002308 [Pseudochelatococcus lubricantis]|uniref:Uncharacterized protein n=2 Tax=Pseudochelatococcus lubricantis TaxID=1538102 RepID=A0ABX0V2A0_9HYPH|nr:DUF6428 family protein [Pseudochelatococcus lubricantis]NIJ58460.1 hypothetical protein [Pseudochelatococcus lubricantis]